MEKVCEIFMCSDQAEFHVTLVYGIRMEVDMCGKDLARKLTNPMDGGREVKILEAVNLCA